MIWKEQLMKTSSKNCYSRRISCVCVCERERAREREREIEGDTEIERVTA